MNSLDELFGEALDREALATTQERRYAVAETTVHRARRRRRVRAGAQVLGVVAVVGVGAVVGSLALAGRGVDPAQPTPGTPAPSATSAPAVDLQADPRLPQAPAITADDWVALDATWDVEFASFAGGEGSTVALYVTPPGGERLLAYAEESFPLKAPIMIGFNSAAQSATLFDPGTGQLWALTARTGAMNEFLNQSGTEMVAGAPLGRTREGASVWSLRFGDTAGEVSDHVFVEGEDNAQELPIEGDDPSPVWGDWVVTHVARGFSVVNVSDGTAAFFVGEGCSFLAWHLDGTFDAECGADIVNYAPAGAESIVVGAAADHEVTTHAIDGSRAWMGEGTSGSDVRPPTVTQGDSADSNLFDGFSATPATYAVIFGARN